MIRVCGLRKRYGSLVAVDGVDFEVARGETFGLLGPNGAGKTTTIHMLVGVLAPDGGTVRIDGDGDPMRAAVRRRIGVAPQALALYDDFSANENLRFFGQLYGLTGASLRDAISHALHITGLEARRHDYVKTYSGGMKRRLNLAVAVMHRPDILLLDEPTVGVDPQSRNHLFENIEALSAEGCTVLYTTHYMEEAERLCDRVAIMDHGRILALDTVDALIDAHGGSSVVEAELERPPSEGVAVPGRLNGTSLRVDTARPFETVAQLAGSGLQLRTCVVRRPDLESVFLNLTGRSLRDA
ncbi:MAG: ABC transporter ATP-binding protein [Phycisphaerae bacterium]|nr:ABC transporter ATP-binding protein [Phycisphaerae bacterium]